ncbi:hypothetical protein LEP1GSC199_0105 [Leptospira vanthielii serovar Holland str. Waz Holland = ATCC 700522]|uniref:Uncharacterized protein n=1 Tax=Leptospira vanthielii serovar Holland str. Waz Holland = ATCC 700522 TaxID=1218591 RepID=N1WF56_9LEPT|nr:hypothetical protein LEP1GSC199_0105 [Leptospira vanthielii serovar Holland str. Waz Holland = ATCC 700522]
MLALEKSSLALIKQTPDAEALKENATKLGKELKTLRTNLRKST